jgi:hypothetical protein
MRAVHGTWLHLFETASRSGRAIGMKTFNSF